MSEPTAGPTLETTEPTPERKTIQQLRDARGWNQMELAYRAGVSLSTISNIEAGQQVPRVTLARRLAEILGVEEATIEWLDNPRRPRKTQPRKTPGRTPARTPTSAPTD